MAEGNDIEQKVKITYDTNADEASSEVGGLVEKMDDVGTSMAKAEKATKSLEAVEKSFKTQLKEANEELRKTVQKYGETSAEAVTAAKKVAELKDQMQFAKDLTDNFNPDQKFKALGAATQIATTATSGLVSGYALLGDQGEETQKMLLKVQAAMAFSDAVSNLSNLGDQWKVFKTTVSDGYNAIFNAKKREIVVTEAQTVAERIKNMVILSNPYIAVAAAIVAVTVVTVAWIKYSNEAADAQKKVGDAIGYSKAQTEALTQSIDDYNKFMSSTDDLEVLRAKSLGATDAQIQKVIKSQKDLAVSSSIESEKKAYQNFIKAQENTTAAFKSGNDDLIKEAQEADKAAHDLWRKTAETKSAAIVDQMKTELQFQIDNNKKSEDIQKAAYDKAKAERAKRKQEAEAEAKAKYDSEQAWLKLQNDAEKAFLNEIDSAKKAYSDRLKSEEQVKIDDENARYALQLENARKFGKDTEDLELEHLNIINDINLEAQQKKYDQEKAIDDAKLAYKKELQDAEINLASNAANFLSAIAGKNKTLQKVAILAESGVGIAKMIIANNAANIGALATPQAIATSGASAAPVIAYNNISTALGVGATIAATAKALQSLGGGGAPSVGNTTKSGGSSPGSASPQVTFQGSSENQIANGVSNKMNQMPPIKAFVIESELTNIQNDVAGKKTANSI